MEIDDLKQAVEDSKKALERHTTEDFENFTRIREESSENFLLVHTAMGKLDDKLNVSVIHSTNHLAHIEPDMAVIKTEIKWIKQIAGCILVSLLTLLANLVVQISTSIIHR